MSDTTYLESPGSDDPTCAAAPINPTYVLPGSALEHATAIVGRTGSGKTYTAKTVVEHLLNLGARVCIIDVTGVWYGLRRRKDGSDGYPVIIFGGEHGDVPITDSGGAGLGRLVATGQVHSSIIDVSEFTGGETTRFLTDFFEELYAKANRQPLHLIMDEADVYAPQQPLPDQRRVQGAVNKIVRRGRVKGFRPLMITQRPAVIDKSVLSQVATLITMRLTSPQDRKAIEDWVKSNAAAAQAKQVIDALPGLAIGEGWVWSPADDLLEKVQFPEITTSDTGRTPQHGEVVPPPPPLKDIDLGALREALAADEEEESPAKARKASEPSAAQLEAAERSGYRRGLIEMVTAEIARLTDLLAELTSGAEPVAKIAIPLPTVDTAPKKPAASLATASKPSGTTGMGAERKPLQVLAAAYPAGLTESQWATLAGFKRSGGTWAKYKSLLRTAGAIERDGNLWRATAIGVEACGEVIPHPKTPEERIEMWASRISGAGKLLRILAHHYPRWLSRDDLAALADLEPTGGTFAKYVSLLSSNELIEKNAGQIKAADALFIENGKR